MNDIVVRAENVSKHYRLGIINHGTLYRDLQSWWARRRNLPDPNVSMSDYASDRKNKARLDNDIFHALDDVSFEISRGDIVGVIGRNGAGKSTLLKLMSRITRPTSGYIGIRGRIASLLEVGTGFHPELTGRENVYLNGAILGMTHAEVRRKFDEIVEFAEIGEFIDTPVKRYSSGMYVRLAFSVAAHLDPEILLVDEVLAVGDVNFQNKCMGRMQEVTKAGRTIMFVSHNMTAVSSLCPRSILLSDGRVAAIGGTSDVIRSYFDRPELNGKMHFEAAPQDVDGKAVVCRLSIKNEDGEIAQTVELTKNFIIEVEYELREPLTGLSVGLQVMMEDGYSAVISLSDPELDVSRLDARPPGYYRAQVTIPAGLLNTGTFYLRAGISSRFSIYSVVEGIRFEVEDNVGIIQMLGQQRKPSISAIQLPWDVKMLYLRDSEGLLK
ncbi:MULTISPECIES: ABC transporter ATP-binding protein [Rhizobium]|jgi:lipopolysaccharide transport system ATP-binding protein|uniref:ABC transporter ATP-binding protein n=1 Tax=Rhizobium TaxID=379 RepID=UPI000522F91C|nr:MULTISPECIES: ABC transporter ATP-binding protein [Rhizobium]KPN26532.1 sugar ABC transporter ATP-binding protein [Rhizobium brockwellii]MDV4153130.1 ABC transporter ATP-binding protein [Rhizobium brockwellii]QJX03837.1 ABC transporter ATP-binding protein [Rhizobium brockwellii]TAV72409.1 ABC transporter ATP-binding protein [Rhizobium leguminosarum]TAV77009.1 ABC transporter ATP-binding protein [Rhizobium leguminosarum]